MSRLSSRLPDEPPGSGQRHQPPADGPLEQRVLVVRKDPDVTILDTRPARRNPAEQDRSVATVAAQPGQAGSGVASRDPMARLEALFDPGTVELLLPADSSGVLAGEGLIDGMPAVAFASDPRVQGGAMGSAGCAAIVMAYDRALAIAAPVIALWHSGGARLRE